MEEMKETERIMRELETTIRTYGASSNGFGKILELSKRLRDAAFHRKGMDTGERTEAFELIRHAKLLALAHANAQEYLERLEHIEDDIRRIA